MLLVPQLRLQWEKNTVQGVLVFCQLLNKHDFERCRRFSGSVFRKWVAQFKLTLTLALNPNLSNYIMTAWELPGKTNFAYRRP